MVIKRLTNHLTDCASGEVAGGRNDCFSVLFPAPKQATDVSGREKLWKGSSTQDNGDNTLMTVSSYRANPQRRQDFEGKTIWRGRRQRRKKAHKHRIQAFLDVFLYIEMSLAPLCVSIDNNRRVRKIGLHLQSPANMCMGKEKRVNIQIYKYFTDRYTQTHAV